MGTTVGNDATQQSFERIDVVKEPREADAAWLEGGGVGTGRGEVTDVVPYESWMLFFVAQVESRFPNGLGFL